MMFRNTITLALGLVATFAAGNVINEPPPVYQKANTARWMVNSSTWGVISTISTRKGMEGSPFGNPNSIADVGGIPYFFVSALDQSMTDIYSDSRVSLTLSEAQGVSENAAACTISYPNGAGDPESPVCSRLVISGTFVNISGTDEEATASKALFAKHPAMSAWPTDHDWFVGKISIVDIWLIDIYGGASIIAAEDYYAIKL